MSIFKKKKEESEIEPVIEEQFNGYMCSKGIPCEECSERFKCWTERRIKFQEEVRVLRETLKVIEEELAKDNLDARQNSLDSERYTITKRLNRIKVISETLGNMEQDTPPPKWHYGMITKGPSSHTIDLAVPGNSVDKHQFIAKTPKRVIDIYKKITQTFDKGNLVVFSDNKDVFIKWDAAPFEAKLFAYADGQWYHLASWNDKEE